MPGNLNNPFGDYLQALLIVAVVLNFLLCFVGFIIWRVQLGLTGFFIGAVVGTLAGILLAAGAPGRVVPTALIGGLIGAIGGASLFAGVVPLGTFLVVGCNAFSAMSQVSVFLGATQQASLAVGAVAGLLAGLVAATTGRPGIIVSSALLGGFGLVDGGYHLAHWQEISRWQITELNTQLAIWAGGLVAAGIGMTIQFAASRARPIAKPTARDLIAVPPSDEVATRLRQLSVLHAQGLITADELQQKRSQILGRL